MINIMIDDTFHSITDTGAKLDTHNRDCLLYSKYLSNGRILYNNVVTTEIGYRKTFVIEFKIEHKILSNYFYRRIAFMINSCSWVHHISLKGLVCSSKGLIC